MLGQREKNVRLYLSTWLALNARWTRFSPASHFTCSVSFFKLALFTSITALFTHAQGPAWRRPTVLTGRLLITPSFTLGQLVSRCQPAQLPQNQCWNFTPAATLSLWSNTGNRALRSHRPLLHRDFWRAQSTSHWHHGKAEATPLKPMAQILISY